MKTLFLLLIFVVDTGLALSEENLWLKSKKSRSAT